jgi:hypothetical protein
MVPINYLAVLVCGLVAMGLGFLWYGVLFGKLWIKEMGWSEAEMEAARKKGMAKQYIFQIIGAFLMAFVIAHNLEFAMAYLQTSGVSAGLQTGFWNWIGFVVPVSMASVLWEGKSLKYWGITAGYYLVAMCIMGVILALWQ